MNIFVLAMSEIHKISPDPVVCYRDYYFSKSTFAKWEKGTDAPYWWREYMEKNVSNIWSPRIIDKEIRSVL